MQTYGNYGNYGYQQGYSGQTGQTTYPVQGQPQPMIQTAVPAQYTIPTVLVSSFDEVLNYPVGAGNTVFFVDFKANKFWMKSTLKNGVPSPLRTFNFDEEMQQQQPSNQNDGVYVTKEDFDDLSKRLNSLIERLGGDK